MRFLRKGIPEAPFNLAINVTQSTDLHATEAGFRRQSGKTFVQFETSVQSPGDTGATCGLMPASLPQC